MVQKCKPENPNFPNEELKRTLIPKSKNKNPVSPFQLPQSLREARLNKLIMLLTIGAH